MRLVYFILGEARDPTTLMVIQVFYIYILWPLFAKESNFDGKLAEK